MLLWGVGNEMEGPGGVDGDNPLIWKAVDDIAAMIKREDPNHPTMTVVAEISGPKVAAVHKHCPHVDVLGINSYGGGRSVAQRYREAGGTKPFVVTEFGPAGMWEVEQDRLGRADRTDQYPQGRRVPRDVRADRPRRARQARLGSYAFIWGHKQEATATWFGLFLPGGIASAPPTSWRALDGEAAGEPLPGHRVTDAGGPPQGRSGYRGPRRSSRRADPEGDRLAVAGSFRPTAPPTKSVAMRRMRPPPSRGRSCDRTPWGRMSDCPLPAAVIACTHTFATVAEVRRSRTSPSTVEGRSIYRSDSHEGATLPACRSCSDDGKPYPGLRAQSLRWIGLLGRGWPAGISTGRERWARPPGTRRRAHAD